MIFLGVLSALLFGSGDGLVLVSMWILGSFKVLFCCFSLIDLRMLL
jgi:hypothetical protein